MRYSERQGARRANDCSAVGRWRSCSVKEKKREGFIALGLSVHRACGTVPPLERCDDDVVCAESAERPCSGLAQALFKPCSGRQAWADDAGRAAHWSSVPIGAFHSVGSAARLPRPQAAAPSRLTAATARNLPWRPTHRAQLALPRRVMWSPRKPRCCLRGRGGDAPAHDESEPAVSIAREQKPASTVPLKRPRTAPKNSAQRGSTSAKSPRPIHENVAHREPVTKRRPMRTAPA